MATATATQDKPNTGDEKQMRGMTKSAILLMALKADSASRVLKLLDPDLIEDITREIAQLDMVDVETRGKVVDEFYHLALARQYLEVGGLGYAKQLLGKALNPEEAKRILSIIEHQVFQQPFAFLQKTETENLLTFIQDEHPQTIALVLAHMPAGKSSEILMGLPPGEAARGGSRVANMEQTNPEVIKEVERGWKAAFRHRLAAVDAKWAG
jgi:flagellar motor switch protein FliG